MLQAGLQPLYSAFRFPEGDGAAYSRGRQLIPCLGQDLWSGESGEMNRRSSKVKMA